MYINIKMIMLFILLSGLLKDITGSYDQAFYISGAMLATVSIVICFQDFVSNHIRNKRTSHVQSTLYGTTEK